MINLTNDFASSIAKQIVGKNVQVTPFFGPVCQNVIELSQSPGQKVPLNPYNFSKWLNVSSTFRVWYLYPIYVATFEVWRIPTTRVVDLTNCTTVPAAFRTASTVASSKFNLNGAIIGGKQVIMIPKGATVTDLTGCENLGVRANYMHYWDDFGGVAYFTFVDTSIYIGQFFQDPRIAQSENYDQQNCRLGFVDAFSKPIKHITYTEGMWTNGPTTALTSHKPYQDWPGVRVANAFAPDNYTEAFYTQNNDDFLREQSYFVPYCLGFKFQSMSADSSIGEYLTLALTP